MTDELAGLPDGVIRFVAQMDAAADGFDMPFTTSIDPKQWNAIRAELLRLNTECAQHLKRAMENGQDAQRAEAELATARETIKRLNRRVQVAEAAIAEKVKESSGRSLGRALANAAFDMMQDERDKALAELAELRSEYNMLATEKSDLEDANSILGSASNTDFARAHRAEAELAALKKRIDEAPTCTLRAIVQGSIVWPVASDLSGDTRVALLPVGGE